MKKYYEKWKNSFNKFLNIFVLSVVLIILVLGIFLVREKLLQNTQNLGMSLARSYASEEEIHIELYKNILSIGAGYVDDLYNAGDTDEIQGWLENYLKKISELLGEEVFDPYAVIDGSIIAANPWEGDEEYDYGSTEWYQKAVEADGNVIYTNVYQDAITGKAVVTLAKELERDGDVIVMDLYPDNARQLQDAKELPEDCSFYLCDSQGQIITAITPWNVSDDVLQDNADYLLEGIQDGWLIAYDASFRDYEGKERGAYYYEMSNGWTVILTIPFESVLLGEKNAVINVLVVVGGMLFLLLAVMVLRDLIQMRKMRMSENTIRILGDSFYAIYLVDYKKGTYEFIKPSKDIAEKVPLRGDYNELLNVIKTYVETEVSQDFEYSFSLEQIRERVREKVYDYGGDYKRRFRDGYKWVNVRTLYNEKVAPDIVIFCFRNVELEKRQQQQHMVILRDALETARESAKEKEAFFNNMSHDMRTPLNAIIGYSDLVLKSGGNWEKIVDYMDKIRHAGRQLLTLINDILELSRIQSGKSILKNQEFNIENCIRESASLFEEMAAAQKKTFITDIQVTDKEVFGDPFKVEQIMNNLLSNAFKYSNPGAIIQIRMRQYVSMKRNKYEIAVTDTGIGMSEEFLKHIFDPYSRETTFATKAIIGTGLGMPIVKSLVQQLSGEIEAESRLGEGSRFTLRIPFEVVNKQGPVQSSEMTGEKKAGLKGCRILLAEDNELNMEIATEILKMNEVEVIPAVNGEEAVHAFSVSPEFSLDAILMDMQMPVMDGCEAARTIRALNREDAKTIPIIAVTANAFAEDIAKTENAGMNGHISKPIDFRILTETLEQLINQYKNR